MKPLDPLKKITLTVICLLLCTIGSSMAIGGSRDLLFHMGMLLDDEGIPVNEPLDVTFRLYSSETSTTAVWEETQEIEFENGVYTVALGNFIDLTDDVFEEETLFLGVTVDGDNEMLPRLPFFAVPFAKRAAVAEVAHSLADEIVTSGHIVDGSIQSADIETGGVGASDIANGAIGAQQIASSGVVPGTYTLATINVDADGRIISAASGSGVFGGGNGDITGVLPGLGLVGGGLTGDVILSLAPGGVSTTEILDGTITSLDMSSSAGITDAQVSDTLTASNLISTGAVVSDAEVDNNLTLSGAIIDSSAIGATTASTGRFTTLSTTNQSAMSINPYGTAAGNTGELRFLELAAGGTNYIGLKAPDAITTDKIWTLPDADGTSGQFLSTNGSGILSWSSSGGGGDISGVTAGSGLSGGGTSGDVTLDVGAGTGLSVSADAIGITAGGVGQTEIATDGVGTAEIAADAVTSSEIASDAVSVSEIAADGVGSSEIASDAVGASEIATDGVGSAEIAADAVGSSEIAADAVGTSEIATDGVGSAEITADAVGSSEIAADAVGTSEIAADGVGSAEIAADAVGSSEIAATAVSAGSYTFSSITVDADGRLTAASSGSETGDISAVGNATSGATFVDGTDNGSELVYEGATVNTVENRLAFTGDPSSDTTVTIPNVTGTIITSGDTDTVTSGMIGADVIGSSEIAADAVGSSEIATDGVASAEIAADAVGSSEIAADAVGTSEIATDGVGSAEIAAGAVGTSEISDNTVAGSDIAATVTFSDADFVDLAAILHDDASAQGLRLPNVGASPADITGTSEGYLAWDESSDRLLVNTGSVWSSLGNPFATSIDSSEITDSTITTDDIAADTIAAADIAADAVGSSEIAADAVGTSEIATDGVGSAEIAADAVGSSEIAATAVSAGSYTFSSITVDADGRLTAASSGSETGDISAVGNATSGAAFVDGTDNGSELVYEGATVNTVENRLAFTGDPSSDTTVTIPNVTGTIITSGDTDTVTSGMIGADVIGSSEIAADAVGSSEIAADAVGTSEIATDGVGSAEIAAGAVGTSEISDNTVAGSDIAATVTFSDADFVDLAAILHDDASAQGLRLPNVGASPTDITGTSEGYLAWDESSDRLLVNTGSAWSSVGNPFATSIDSSEITDSTITTDDIASDTIAAADIAADAVGSSEIAADAVGTSEIATDGVGSAEIAADAVGSSEIAATTVSAGSYTFSSITVDADGRLTAASSGSETGDISAVGNATSGAAFVDGTDNGSELVYEGATVNTVENRLAFTGDPSSDTTVTIPNVTGTIITSGDTDTVTSGMIGADVIGSSEIAADAVGSSEIAADAVGTSEIATDGVGSAEIAADAVGEAELKVVDSPADEECFTYETTTGDFEWQACSAGSGDVSDIGNCASGACFTDGNTAGSQLTYEGATDNSFETILAFSSDPSADTTVTIPNVTGTLVTTGDTATVTGTMISNDTVALTTDTAGNYVATITAGGGLTGDVSAEGATPTLAVGAGNGITVNADDITVDATTTSTTATTSSNSGLEATATGVRLLGGCADTEILKWNAGTSVWECKSSKYLKFISVAETSVVALTAQSADVAGTDVDVTSQTSANATHVLVSVRMEFGTIAVDSPWTGHVMPDGTAVSDSNVVVGITTGDSAADSEDASMAIVQLTAGQIFDYGLDEITGSATADFNIYVLGYWEPVTTGADLAENYYTNDTSIEAGHLVSLDVNINPLSVKKSDGPYDSKFLGIVSSAPAIVLDEWMDPNKGVVILPKSTLGQIPVPVALSGRVPVKVIDENGTVKPGDYLTSSSKPGYAMKATRSGHVLGKALSELKKGEGEVLVFIESGYYASSGADEKRDNVITAAGTVLSDSAGLAEVFFEGPVGPAQPIVHLTSKGDNLVFAQVSELIQDEDLNYTGFVMKTFDMGGFPLPHAETDYMVVIPQK